MQKNLNDIIPPSRRRALEAAGGPAYVPPEPPPRTQRAPRPERGPRKFPVVTAGVAALVVLASVGALFAFADASVAVTPTQNAVTLDGQFIASADGDLPFEVLTVEKVGSASVPSEGLETVEQSAQGSIVITNRQDVPQQLIKNTRFETPDGLVFRIRDSVTVPAAGTLTATVYADATGDAYNVGPTTFTLPGLAGTSMYDLVSAASSEPMRGGFSGERASVDEATREARGASIREGLAPQIDTALRAAVPEGYILLPGASRVAYEPQPDGPGTDDSVELSEKATATAVIFPEGALARAIAYQSVGSYSGEPISLGDTAGLTLAPVGDLPVPGATEFAFGLSGGARLVWDVDGPKIAAAVAGKTRESAGTLIAGFPEVDRAEFVLRPFWSRTYPQDPERITVTVDDGA